jgi:hypothetical protein
VSAHRTCSCGSGLVSFPLHDAQGIYVQRVCDRCEAAVKRKFRPEIFRGYTQADVDEPIESESHERCYGHGRQVEPVDPNRGERG